MPRGGSSRPAIKDEQLIAELLTGCNLPEASRRTGQSLSVVKRRNSDPGFQRRLMEHQEEVVKRVKRSLTDKAIEAADVLLDIVKDVNGEASRDGATQRITAGRALLSSFVQLQPKVVDDPFDTSAPVIHYVLEGVNPEALR